MANLHSRIVQMLSSSRPVTDNNRYTSKTCIERDSASMNIIEKYCKARFLFDLEVLSKSMNRDLMNITTGLIAPPNVNIVDSKDVGELILKEMDKFSPTNYKFSRSMTATQIPSKNDLQSSKKKATPSVNTELMYQRLSSLSSEDERKAAFSHELSTYPTALFTEEGIMRESTKSKLAKLLITLAEDSKVSSDQNRENSLIIDGGMLLHSVNHPWRKGVSFTSILQAYVTHVKHLRLEHGASSLSCTVVFDGYLTSTTKDHAHMSRYPVKSLEVQVTNETIFDSQKNVFLSNPINKQKFVNMLSATLSANGISCINCEEDADLEIVRAALTTAIETPVRVLADDADITILLVHRMSELQEDGVTLKEVYQSHVGDLHDVQRLCHRLPSKLKENLLLVHSFSGCDTTCSVYNQGYHAITNEKLPADEVRKVFYDADASEDEIVRAGEVLMLNLYGSKCSNLNEQRFLSYHRKVHSGSEKKKQSINPATLPPTSHACKQHSLRVYHQIQCWLGVCKDPLMYGWERDEDSMLCPVYTDLEAAPATLLRPTKCACKTNCTGRCSCVKKKVKCGYSCECNVDICSNRENDDQDTDEQQSDYQESCSDSDKSDFE